MKDKDTKLLEEAYTDKMSHMGPNRGFKIDKLESIANLAYNLIDVPERHAEALERILKIASPELYKEYKL